MDPRADMFLPCIFLFSVTILMLILRALSINLLIIFLSSGLAVCKCLVLKSVKSWCSLVGRNTKFRPSLIISRPFFLNETANHSRPLLLLLLCSQEFLWCKRMFEMFEITRSCLQGGTRGRISIGARYLPMARGYMR